MILFAHNVLLTRVGLLAGMIFIVRWENKFADYAIASSPVSQGKEKVTSDKYSSDSDIVYGKVYFDNAMTVLKYSI